MRDFVAFEEHVEGIAASVGAGAGVPPEWYQAPTFYFTNPYALIGAFDDAPVPDGSRRLDFELEVAAVIGRNGASVPAERAADHIFGYTILNDWSARDLQAREMKVMLGPGQGQGLRHHSRPLAGHRGRARALPGRRRLPRARAAGRGTWVRAGDVLGSGTCGNDGCLAELWGRRGELGGRPSKSKSGSGLVSGALVAGDTLDDGGVFC